MNMRSAACHARRALLTAAPFMLLSCASLPPTQLHWDRQGGEVSAPLGGSHETLYHREVSQWTRQGEVFERFEGKLFVNATCLSPAFEAARAAWHSERRALTTQERNIARSQLLQRTQGQLLFFVAIATQDQSSNDLRPRGGPLKAHLITQGRVFEPRWITELSVQERISAPVDFPYLSPLYKAYWVSFPPPKNVDQLSLRVSSLTGTVTLNWDLQDGTQALKERR